MRVQRADGGVASWLLLFTATPQSHFVRQLPRKRWSLLVLPPSPPDPWAEHEYEREYLQPAEEHIERQHQLACVGKGAEVAAGADHGKAGADVAYAGQNAGYGSCKVKIVKRHKQHGRRAYRHERGNVAVCAAHYGCIYALAVHAYGHYAARLHRAHHLRL